MPENYMRTYGQLTITTQLRDAIINANEDVWYMFRSYGRPEGRGDYLGLATDGQIAWRPEARILRNEFGAVLPPADQYVTKGRMRGKPAKTLRNFMGNYGNTITDVGWEIFSNRFLAEGDEKTTIEVVSGKDVRTLYHEDKITTKRSAKELRNSCMRYDSTADFLWLYANNPNKIQMAVELDEDGGVVSRALVWKTDRGITFMDRIYGDGNSAALLQKFAKDNGWWYRAYNTYAYPNRVVIDGEVKTRMMRVTLDDMRVTRYPYLDTFMWYSLADGVLCNTQAGLKGREDLVQLRTTNGNYHVPYRRRRY
jgi:hypothetical protein